MMKRTKWLLGAGALLAVTAVGARVVGEPVLVRYPTNINETMHYTGTATLYLNPATGAALATPLKSPLDVSRNVKVASHNFSHAVVQETDVIRFAGTTQTTSYQYYMDRRTMKMVNGAQSYAFGNAANQMNTNGSYRVNFPLATSSTTTYKAWAPETNSSITVSSTGPAHQDPVAGVKVVTFQTNLDHAVAPYYTGFLKTMGMPMSLPTTTVAAQLQAAGGNVSQVLADVSPHLTSAQLATLTGALTKPVPLNYSYFQQGLVSVDSKTGAVVNADVAREGVKVAPDLSGTAPATAILANYANVPSVQALSKAVASVSKPQVALQMTYKQTPASAQAAAAKSSSQAKQMDLIRWQLPAGIGALALIVLLIAVLTRHRPHPGATPQQVEFGTTSQGKKAA